MIKKVLLTSFVGNAFAAQSYYDVAVDNTWSQGRTLFGGSYSGLSSVTLSDDDATAIDLPWSFDYFGNAMDKVAIASNGVLSFYSSSESSASSAGGAADFSIKSKAAKTKPAPKEPADKKKIASSKLIVALKPDADASKLGDTVRQKSADESLPSFTGEVLDVYEGLHMITIDAPSDEALAFLRDNEDVIAISEDELLSIDPIYPDESEGDVESLTGRRLANSPYSWGLDRIDQDDLPLDSGNFAAPAYTSQGEGTEIYIVDTGIDTNHAEFSGSARVVQNIFNAYGPVTANTDGDGHGTHCAGTAAGKNVGVAPLADIYGVKVLSDEGSGSSTVIVDGLNAILNRKLANPTKRMVVSMSLGGFCGTSCSTNIINIAVGTLTNEGIIVVVAAGNSEDDACEYHPASAPSAITVGATTIDDVLAGYSNYGSCVDILAPGSRILSACSSTSSSDCDSTNPQYLTISGTSMATPHVAGVAALWMSMTDGSALPTAASATAALQCTAIKATITSYLTKNLLLKVPNEYASFDAAACDLTPTCPSACQNGGVCVAGNRCQCPAGQNNPTCRYDPSSSDYCCDGLSMSASSPPFNALAALWTDLNPSATPIRYGSLDADRFAIVFNNVRSYHSASCTVTFEVVLNRNGMLDFAIVRNTIGTSNGCASRPTSIGIKGPSGESSLSFLQWFGPSLRNIPRAYRVTLRKRVPTASPTPRPSTASPTRLPTTASPTRVPTSARPTRVPTSARPSAAPVVVTRSPTRARRGRAAEDDFKGKV